MFPGHACIEIFLCWSPKCMNKLKTEGKVMDMEIIFDQCWFGVIVAGPIRNVVFFNYFAKVRIADISEIRCRKSKKKITFFMKIWPLSLLLSPQEWHHVGCRWRLRPGRHNGRSPPCGGTAPQAYGQPVEQSAVLNLKPEPATHLQVFSILSNRNTHSCNSYWTATTRRNFLPFSVTLADPHHNSLFIFSFSCPQEIWKRTGRVMNSCLLASLCLCGENKPTIKNQWYWHLTEAGINVLSRLP